MCLKCGEIKDSLVNLEDVNSCDKYLMLLSDAKCHNYFDQFIEKLSLNMIEILYKRQALRSKFNNLDELIKFFKDV